MGSGSESLNHKVPFPLMYGSSVIRSVSFFGIGYTATREINFAAFAFPTYILSMNLFIFGLALRRPKKIAKKHSENQLKAVSRRK